MKILCIDSGGLHVDTARQLAKQKHTVWYFVPYFSAYAKFADAAPGHGVPGIIKILDYANYLDQADVIFFPDVGMGDLAHFLREKGYTVFGAGKGEILEQDREGSVKIMNQLGIKCPETHAVKGIDAALAKLKELFGLKETNQSATGKYFIKINIFRGSFDSFPAENLETAQYMFDKLRSQVGPAGDTLPICIQKTVDGIECGLDLFFNGKEFLKPYLMGFETGGSYCGKLTDDMGIFKADMDKFIPWLQSVNYHGAFSFEAFYDGKDCHYIDITTRFPYPLGFIYPTYCDDFAALLHEVASGTGGSSRLPSGKFVGCMEVKSEDALETWLPLKGGENTRFCRYMMSGDKAFAVPGTSLVAAVMGSGDSMEAVEEAVNQEAESLNIFFSDKNEKFVSDIKSKYIEPLKEKGFDYLGDQNLKPVMKDRQKDRTKPETKSTESIVQRKVTIQERLDTRSDKRSADPLDEIRDMMESIAKPAPRPSQEVPVPRVSQERNEPAAKPKKCSPAVFAQPVDNYGIPL